MVLLFDHWRRTSDGYISTDYEQFSEMRIDGRSRIKQGPAVPVMEGGKSIGRLRLELVGGRFRANLSASKPVPVCVNLIREGKRSVLLAGASVSEYRVEVAQ